VVGTRVAEFERELTCSVSAMRRGAAASGTLLKLAVPGAISASQCMSVASVAGARLSRVDRRYVPNRV
jgi:hypothetical protein